MRDEQAPIAGDVLPGGVPSGHALARLPLVHGNFVVPSAPAGFVDRPRLRADLDAAMARPLTVLSASAGWGKTTLLASWSVGRSGRPPLVWIRLDPATRSAAESEPGLALWPQLRHGLRLAGIIGPDALRDGDESAPATATDYRPLANLLATRTEPVVIVLDDVHRVRHAADLGGLDLLLEHAGDRVRLVVAGRSVAMALHRPRADGRVTEFGPRDLAFSEREAVDLLRLHQPDPWTAPPDTVADLVGATEGWPTGLRLALAAGGPPEPRDTAGVSSGAAPAPVLGRAQDVLARAPDIADFLRAEVLDRHSPEARRFLLRTSLLDEVTGPLAEVVVADGSTLPGAGRLADLAEHDGFVVELAGDRGYRYHRLLAAMLRADLARDRGEDVDELNLRAALWFTAHRRPLDAIRHAVQAGDWWYAACLLLDGSGRPEQAGLVGALLGPTHVLDSTLAGLPAAPAHCAEWALVVAVRALRAGQPDRAGGALRTAREAIAVAPASRRRWLGVQADLIDLSLAELTGAPEQMQSLARRLLRPPATTPAAPTTPTAPATVTPSTDAPASEPPVSSGRSVAPVGLAASAARTALPVDVDEIVYALARCGRGRAHLWLGRPDTAADDLLAALDAARSAASRAVATSAGGALALALALRGRLRLAESHACDVLALVGGTARPAEPDQGLDRPGAAAPTGVLEAHLALVVVALGRVDRELAARHLRAARACQGSGHPPGLLDLITIWQARLLQRLGHPDDLRAARRLLGGQSRPTGPPLCVSLWQAAEIDLLLASGNAQAARAVLERGAPSRQADHVRLLARARVELGCADLTAADQAVSALLRAGGGGGPTVTACVFAAVIAARRDDHARATDLLARGLALAEDEGFASPFLDLGSEVTALLDAHPGLSSAHPRFVTELRGMLTRENATVPTPGRAPSGRPVTVTERMTIGASVRGEALPAGSPSGGMPAPGPRPGPSSVRAAQQAGTVRVPAPAGPRAPIRPGGPVGVGEAPSPSGAGGLGRPSGPGSWERGPATGSATASSRCSATCRRCSPPPRSPPSSTSRSTR
ncbi:hypothetical protein [Candidatus Frankia nodulisporulans]|uniref:hypothetical protein n=1 Tax=Candidatus Frankia nodulisporulans TaxID=2060052 RepID=UPI0013D48CE7|nr:hypothetical protein [Candidatus Frankia nodulisporulans]